MKIVYSYTAFANGACVYVSGVDALDQQRWATECPWFAGDCWDLFATSPAQPDWKGRPLNGIKKRSKHAMRHARMDLPPYDEDAAVRWVAEGKLPSDEPLTGGG